MGESAGAVGVGHLINTMPDNPPFRAAILQSGSSMFTPPPNPRNNDTSTWDALIELLGCTELGDAASVLTCVRQVPANTIRDLIQTHGLRFGSYAWDNVTTLEYPAPAWFSHNVAKVPILIGSTAQDGSIFALGAGDNVSTAIASAFGTGTVGRLLSQIYTPHTTATAGLITGNEIIAQIQTDYLFRCSSGFAANLTSTMLNVPAWQYVFDAVTPSNDFAEYAGVHLGAFHASEIPMVFGTYTRENSTETEADLSASMQKQFADFIKDPMQGPGWTPWPMVATLGVNEAGTVTSTENVTVLDPVCRVWNELYAVLFATPVLEAIDTEASNGSTNGTITEPSDGTNSAGGAVSTESVSSSSTIASAASVGVFGVGIWLVSSLV
jgi:carboxylesterase type B